MTGTVTMYTTPWCGYCHRLKGQMDREGITYDLVDIEQHQSRIVAMSFCEPRS